MSLQYDDIKEVELIVRGEVQGAGYRQYVAKIGRKLKLAGFVENRKDGTVRIRCKGEKNAVLEFKRQINVKNPEGAPLIEVEDIKETQLAQGKIKKKFFEEKYSDSKAEMSQGFSTGMNYMNLFRAESRANFGELDKTMNRVDNTINKMDNTIDTFRAESQANFGKLDETMNRVDNTINKMDNTIDTFRAESKSGMEQINKTTSGLKNETVTRFDRLDKKYDKISQAMFEVVTAINERNKTFESRMEITEKSIESLLKILAQKKT